MINDFNCQNKNQKARTKWLVLNYELCIKNYALFSLLKSKSLSWLIANL